MAERVFAPIETIRDTHRYLLPTLREFTPFPQDISYETVLRHLLHKKTVRILDLGCGAGFWVEQQSYIPDTEVYGITAKDYRRPTDRPTLVFHGYDKYSSVPVPIYKSVDGVHTYLGDEYKHQPTIDGDHYLIGDIHDLLHFLPANYFDIIVSYQTCRYLFDPLRVLKQIHRILTPQGYAFLESFDTQIQGSDGNLLTESQVKKLFTKSGLVNSYGQYYPTAVHRKFGLAFKKKHPRLRLPIKYGQIVESPDDKTRVITYELT